MEHTTANIVCGLCRKMRVDRACVRRSGIEADDAERRAPRGTSVIRDMAARQIERAAKPRQAGSFRRICPDGRRSVEPATAKPAPAPKADKGSLSEPQRLVDQPNSVSPSRRRRRRCPYRRRPETRCKSYRTRTNAPGNVTRDCQCDSRDAQNVDGKKSVRNYWRNTRRAVGQHADTKAEEAVLVEMR